MANYIKTLERKVRDCQFTNAEISDEVMDLVCYLTSDKFSVDTTVQVQDVLNRLQPVRSSLLEIKHNLL